MSTFSLESLEQSFSSRLISERDIAPDLPQDNQWLIYDAINNRFKYEISSGAQYEVTYLRLDGTNLPSANINLNSNKITNLADPTNNKVAKSGDIMTGDLIIKTGTDSFKTLGCDDLFSNANTFNLLMGNSQNKITYNAGPIIINASSGFAVNQNGVDVMSIGKAVGDPRIGVFQDVLVNQNFISDVKDPILDKDAVTKIYSDSLRYMTATPTLDPSLFTDPTIINGVPYTASASSYNGLTGPWEAFKNTFSSTNWRSLSPTNSWITLTFPYQISMSGFNTIPITGCNITSWKIQASNGGAYVDIVPTNTTVFNALTLSRFTFTPSAAYSNWRFFANNATSNVGMSVLQWIPTNPDLSLKKCQTGHVPILNSNVGYRGFIPSASSEFSASFLACNVFRQQYPNSEWATNGVNSNFWIQIKCPVPVRIWKTGLTGRNNGTERIFNWRIEGSNDGITYVTIYTATNPTFLGNVYQEFNMDSIVPFAFYRLFAVNAVVANPGLSVFQLFVYS
jgi:hypothetical protein